MAPFSGAQDRTEPYPVTKSCRWPLRGEHHLPRGASALPRISVLALAVGTWDCGVGLCHFCAGLQLHGASWNMVDVDPETCCPSCESWAGPLSWETPGGGS